MTLSAVHAKRVQFSSFSTILQKIDAKELKEQPRRSRIISLATYAMKSTPSTQAKHSSSNQRSFLLRFLSEETNGDINLK